MKPGKPNARLTKQALKRLAASVLNQAVKDAIHVYLSGEPVRVDNPGSRTNKQGKRESRPRYKRMRSDNIFRNSEPYRYLTRSNTNKAFWCGFLDIDEPVFSEWMTFHLQDKTTVEILAKRLRRGQEAITAMEKQQ